MAEPRFLQQITGAEAFEARIQKTSITTIPKIISNNEKSVRGGTAATAAAKNASKERVNY